MFLIAFFRLFFEVRFSGRVIIPITIIAIVLLFEDKFWNDFYFYSFKDTEIDYYTILFLVPAIEIAVRLLYVFRGKRKRSNGTILIENQPIKKIAELQNTRKSVVSALVGEINNSRFESAYSIGIVGEWGVGKTSFIKAIEGSLDSSSIIVHFSPWMSLGNNSVLQDFLSSITEKLRDFDSSLVNNMTHYINSMVEVEKSTQTNFIGIARELIGKESSKEARFEQINRTISRMQKRIIIFIDDLDRLDASEIIEVLKLIRNAANFSNVVYISCYDKIYLLHALTRFNKRNLGIMLDKFFDVEISVAPIIPEDLIAKIESVFLSKIMVDKETEVQLLKNFIRDNKPFLQFREVNKFLTSLWLNYNIYGSKLCLQDFFIFEIIKVKYTYLPSILLASTDRYFSEASSPVSKSLKSHGDNGELVIIHDLRMRDNEFDRLFLRQDDFNLLTALLNKLFTDKNEHYLAIRQPSFFQAYFYHEIPDADVDQTTFDLRTLINTESYRTHSYFVTGYDFKKETFVINEFQQQFGDEPDLYENGLKVSFFAIFLIDWSRGAINQRFISKCFHLAGDYATYRELVISGLMNDLTFESTFSRIYFLSNHLRSLIYKEKDTAAILEFEDVVRMNSKLFYRFLELSSSLTNHTFSALFHQITDIDLVTKKVLLASSALRYFKEFALKHIEDYLDLIIRSAQIPNYELTFVFAPYTFQIFEVEEFKRLLHESEYPPRKKVKMLEYFDRSINNSEGIREFKAEDTDLNSMPVDFLNAWNDIPQNIRQKHRYIDSTLKFRFNSQQTPMHYNDRNDHMYPEIFVLKNTTFIQVTLKPIETEFWRFGLSFLKQKQFPTVNGGRHHDTEKADVHISVGEQVNEEWALQNQVELREYHIEPTLSEFSRFTKYIPGEQLTIHLAHEDLNSSVWKVSINDGKNQVLGMRRYDLKGFRYVLLSAWCDRKDFQLESSITITQVSDRI
ncbi:hypothetical protein SanaruYs_05640 [Chryseotalea sanaruensis]|uniref:KAP NTPase domain-containing protein n=2 Tax=Chryseotalea sanaruensis TaxID=2482724 RepID=A0A401U644_9BACT|nr:hypothetical protein SanaruYs_05640 [Chryseotalea sanaruensis]